MPSILRTRLWRQPRRRFFPNKAAAGGGTQTITLSGIASTEAFGTLLLKEQITGVGAIASAQAFGTAKLNQNVTGVGAISQGSFGTLSVNLSISGVGGIASLQAFGTPVLTQTLHLIGFGGEVFGTVVLTGGDPISLARRLVRRAHRWL